MKESELKEQFIEILKTFIINDYARDNFDSGYTYQVPDIIDAMQQAYNLDRPTPIEDKGIEGVKEAARQNFIDMVIEKDGEYLQETNIPIEEFYDSGKLCWYEKGAEFGAAWQSQQGKANAEYVKYNALVEELDNKIIALTEQQGKEAETIRELREENEGLNAFIKKIANITALTVSNEGINLRTVIEMAQEFRKDALKSKPS